MKVIKQASASLWQNASQVLAGGSQLLADLAPPLQSLGEGRASSLPPECLGFLAVCVFMFLSCSPALCFPHCDFPVCWLSRACKNQELTSCNLLLSLCCVEFHCVNIPQFLDPLVCWWALRLLPVLGYCKLCCYEHWGAQVLLNSCFRVLRV